MVLRKTILRKTHCAIFSPCFLHMKISAALFEWITTVLHVRLLLWHHLLHICLCHIKKKRKLWLVRWPHPVKIMAMSLSCARNHV